jgi:hypothetical protein
MMPWARAHPRRGGLVPERFLAISGVRNLYTPTEI